MKQTIMRRVYVHWLMREFVYPLVAVTAIGIASVAILNEYVTFGIVVGDLKFSLHFFTTALAKTEFTVQIVLGVLLLSVCAFAYRIFRTIKRPLPSLL